MKKLKNKLISWRLIYGLIISMAITGILFVTDKMVENNKPTNILEAKIEKDEDIIAIERLNLSRKEKSTSKKSNKVSTSKTTVKQKVTRRFTTNSRKNVIKRELKKKSTKKAIATSVKKNIKKQEKNIKKSTTKYISIKQAKISRNMDLSKRTGLSREDFIKLISGVKADTSGFFEKNAGKIYDLCEKYSINEIFFCGLISAESGWNIASNHRRTHNYISLMSGGKLIHYSSVDSGLEIAAQKLHYNYLTPGGKFYHGKTLAGVKRCFCPSSSWVNLVYGRMCQIV